MVIFEVKYQMPRSNAGRRNKTHYGVNNAVWSKNEPAKQKNLSKVWTVSRKQFIYRNLGREIILWRHFPSVTAARARNRHSQLWANRKTWITFKLFRVLRCNAYPVPVCHLPKSCHSHARLHTYRSLLLVTSCYCVHVILRRVFSVFRATLPAMNTTKIAAPRELRKSSGSGSDR